MDPESLATVIVVLKGSKYWILATQTKEDDNICSTNSLGPDWNPYILNVGDNVDLFHFEVIHLQKGDMLWVLFECLRSKANISISIIPPGVLHWVLGTSNGICVGRHFYSMLTICWSVIPIVHTFLLSGRVTNEEHLETRTLLY